MNLLKFGFRKLPKHCYYIEIHYLTSGILNKLLWILALLWVSEGKQSFLRDPPARVRDQAIPHDFDIDYSDYETDSQVFARRMKESDGKYGTCRDPYSNGIPQTPEHGLLFGKDRITRTFSRIIPIKIDLTEVFLPGGFLEYRVSKGPNATQNSLDENVLKIEGSNETKFYPLEGINKYELNLSLPEGLECEYCVFQARYVGGTNWGDCGNGTYAIGCGPQEEFRDCADIAIVGTRPLTPPLIMFAKPNGSLSTPEESSSASINTAIISCGVLASVMVLAFIIIKRRYNTSNNAAPSTVQIIFSPSVSSDKHDSSGNTHVAIMINSFDSPDNICTVWNGICQDGSGQNSPLPIAPPRRSRSRERSLNTTDSKHNNGIKNSSSPTPSNELIPDQRRNDISIQMNTGTVHDHLSKLGIKGDEKPHWVNDIHTVKKTPQLNRKD